MGSVTLEKAQRKRLCMLQVGKVWAGRPVRLKASEASDACLSFPGAVIASVPPSGLPHSSLLHNYGLSCTTMSAVAPSCGAPVSTEPTAGQTEYPAI